MKNRKLGMTGLELSTFSFGAAGIGNLYREVSREDAMATLDTAWDAGIIRALAELDSCASQKATNLNLWHKLEVCDGSRDFITCRF